VSRRSNRRSILKLKECPRFREKSLQQRGQGKRQKTCPPVKTGGNYKKCGREFPSQDRSGPGLVEKSTVGTQTRVTANDRKDMKSGKSSGGKGRVRASTLKGADERQIEHKCPVAPRMGADKRSGVVPRERSIEERDEDLTFFDPGKTLVYREAMGREFYCKDIGAIGRALLPVQPWNLRR